MGIIRVAKNSNYVVMNRTALNDNRLSWKAKGIMAYMLSMPDDWVFYMDELMTHSTDGKASFRAGFNELKQCGYIERKPIREGQRIKEWETMVHEVPINSLLTDFQEVEKQEVENQEVGFQEVENRTLLSTDNNQVLNKPNTDNNQVLTEREESQSVNPFLEILNSFDSTIRVSNFTDHRKMDKLLELYPDHLLIIEAIKVTADKGKSNMEYVEAILRNWRTEKGIQNYADWQLKEARLNATTNQSYERPGDNEYDGLSL
ncbi:DnaD domain protein [Lysinibacillus fusiformis]|uniref:DnaD domain protein n=1 Tax=Lysinibacillus fusiformis TaxID=28031 RepID=UPI00263BCAC7|nr:DnaD domain protein [Lysinibacillus fusiformis]MDC6268045.1 DnaD domain protein [Lysinibacillus sphaericus]MDN4967465.1 DnaD domain protein [Lysinibacillus fusiformis]